jgi:hypothetical protein
MAIKRQFLSGGPRDEREDFVMAEVSFVTAEQTTHKIYFPFPVFITRMTGFVTQVLGATDAGTITLKNHAGAAMTAGAMSIAAGSAAGFEPTPVIPVTNQDIGWGEKVQLTVAKTTTGGKARVQVYYKETV